MRSTLLFACVVVLTTVVSASDCNTKANITYPPNLNNITTDAPTFVNRVPNGELYTVGTEGVNQLYVLHVYGKNGYDFGYAAGTLLKPQMIEVMNRAYNYFLNEIIAAINSTTNKWGIPESIVQLIVKEGLDVVMDLLNDLTAPFTDPEIFNEMHGLADATGIDWLRIRRIHLIGEITKGHCSFYGAWGNATAGGKTLQLRALDWDTGVGLQDFPSVTIYHPENESLVGHAFANVAWTGWIGVLTGMSSKSMGISEIGISYPNYPPYFGDESFVGIPFVYLEREIIQRAKNIYDAMDIIQNANRTCRLMLGIADGNYKTGRLVQYSHSEVNFYNDTDLEPYAWWHPRIENVVYAGMDWDCPFYQHSLYNQLSLYHGTLTPELSIMNVTAAVGTGNLHLAVYDLTDNMMFVANHAPTSYNGTDKNAYTRPFVRLNMTELFNKQYGQ